MQLHGEHRLPTPREAVWQALGDVASLRAAMPGCERLERAEDGSLEMVVSVEAGPGKATLSGRVGATKVEPPGRYTIAGKGDANGYGAVEGTAEVVLAENGDGTRVEWTAEIEVGGLIAQVGGSLIEPTARRLAGEFFTRLSAALAAPREATAGSTFGGEGRSEAVESFGGRVIGDGVDLVEEVEEELELEATRGTWGGPVAWGLIAIAVMALLLIALH